MSRTTHGCRPKGAGERSGASAGRFRGSFTKIWYFVCYEHRKGNSEAICADVAVAPSMVDMVGLIGPGCLRRNRPIVPRKPRRRSRWLAKVGFVEQLLLSSALQGWPHNELETSLGRPGSGQHRVCRLGGILSRARKVVSGSFRSSRPRPAAAELEALPRQYC